MKNNIEKFEKYAVMTIISDTHGEFRVKIDIEDVDKVQSFKWGILKSRLNKFYIVTNQGKTLLHRILMNAPKGKDIDHIRGDTMDNRKSQLRVCTRKENMSNSKHYKNNTSGHKGVTWCKKNEKWMAYIKVDWKQKNLGYFGDIESAVIARVIADELESILPQIEERAKTEQAYGHILRDGGYVQVTKDFISGCRLAHERNEPLEFR